MNQPASEVSRRHSLKLKVRRKFKSAFTIENSALPLDVKEVLKL